MNILETMTADVLTAAAFARIKRFILARGDRRTYCNMFNQNPHITCERFEAYLHPDVGQRNLHCDPALSDFDRLVVQDCDSSHLYYDAQVVGDRLVFDPAHAEPLRRYFAALLVAADGAGL